MRDVPADSLHAAQDAEPETVPVDDAGDGDDGPITPEDLQRALGAQDQALKKLVGTAPRRKSRGFSASRTPRRPLEGEAPAWIGEPILH